MKARNVRRLVGLLIVLISLTLLCWGLWPLGEASRSLLIAPTQMQLPTPEGWLPALLGLVG